jgi:16S rRNA (adenine1518-N6/adenine1519-N6)-dimethyltransferase
MNQTLIGKFIAAGHLEKGDQVLEIGPGKGALTFPLLEKGVDLTAIEISPELSEDLKQKDFRLINKDVLDVNIKSLYPTSEGITLISSVPYNITSPLFEHLFSYHSLFKQYLVIVQKEVGDLLLTSPGSNNYSILSILVQHFTTPQKLFIIARGNFRPMPSVDSMALLLKAKQANEKDAIPFTNFLKMLFSQRRKTLEGAMKTLGLPPISDKRRAETLTPAEIYDLFRREV